MAGLIDTHAHLYEPDYEKDFDAFANELRQNGVEAVVCVGCEIATSKRTLEIAHKYPFIFAEVGFHPCDVGEITDDDWEKMKEMIADPRVVAVGEIGLDYHWDNVPRDIQKKWFIRQLDYANEIDLPVVIHSRKATQDLIEILKEHTPKKGVLHCFSESKETLKEIVKLGLSISMGGVVTFKNARKAVECIEVVPLDRLMLETDCPYLTPEPFRGKLNRPDYTIYTAEKIAEIRGMTTEEIIEITNKNAKEMFGLGEKL